MRGIIVVIIMCSSVLAQVVQTGIIRPSYDIQLSMSVDGKVAKLYYKEGDKVKQNTPILRLDDTLQQLEAKRKEIIKNDTAKLSTLQNTVSILEETYKTKDALYKSTKSVSLNELNEIRLQYLNAKGEQAQTTEEKKREEVEYQISSEVLNLYTLKSPIDGVIVHIKPSIGEWVQTGSSIVRVVNTNECIVELDTDISLLQGIKQSKSIKVEIDNAGTKVQKSAKLELINQVADNASGLVKIKIRFANTDNTAIAGSMATVIFE